MAIRVRTSSNIQRWLRNFERKENLLRKNLVDEPQKQAEFGQQLGKNLAPRGDSPGAGNLINAISFKVVDKNNTKGQAMVWVKPLVHPTDNKSQKTHGRASAYAGIHHSLGLGDYNRGQARSNDPHWLFTVRDELKRRYGKAILGHIQKFR